MRWTDLISFDEIPKKAFDESTFNTNDDYQEMIQTYLDLGDKIKRIQFQQRRLKRWFDQQNFIHSPMAYDSDGVSYIHYPSFDQVVIDYVDTQSALKKLENAMRDKQECFRTITCNLSKDQFNLLRINGADPLLEDSLIEEIKKIEKHINYKYKF